MSREARTRASEAPGTARSRAARATRAAALILSGAAALLLTLPAPSAAQGPSEMGAEGFQVQASDEDLGWGGNADLGFTLTEGNSETTSLSASGRADYRLRRMRWTLDGNFVRVTSEGDETANRGDAELMYDFFPSGRFFIFGKMAAGFNDPAGLDLRLSPGAGVGYQILSGGALDLSVEAGGEWARDAFTDGTVDNSARAAATETFAWKISESADLEQSVTYRPDVEDPGDFLLESRLALTTMITDALGLKVTLRDEFDSEPFDPADEEPREKNDLTFVTGITYRF